MLKNSRRYARSALSFAFLLAALAMPAVASERDCQAVRDANMALAIFPRDCVRSITPLLEQSGESPRDIASAAIQKCSEKFALIIPECNGRAFRLELARALTDEAVARVVEIRASR